MKSQRLQYLLLLLFLGASSFLFAIESRFTNEPSIESRFTDEPSDETSQELLSFIRQSRQQQESGELISLESIDGVNSRYASLNRGRLSGKDLVELKYLTSAWRSATYRYLVRAASHTDREESFLQIVEGLKRLAVTLKPEDIDKLLDVSKKNRFNDAPLISLISDFGDPRFVRLALGTSESRINGPPMFSDFAPIRQSRWGRDGWLGQRNVGAYSFNRDGEIEYRGLRLKSGDFLLVDLHAGYDGLNTSISHPRSSFTHMGQLVVLEEGNHKVPAIFEISENGVRIVPLNVYLSPHFISYAEVYRPANSDSAWGKAVASRVKGHLKEEIGYDFYATEIVDANFSDPKRPCVTCSSLGHLLLQETGMDVPLPRSRIDSGAQKNMQLLGLDYSHYLTPTDFMRADMKFIGVVDNNEFLFNIIRELIVGHSEVSGTLGHFLSHNSINSKNLPMDYKVLRHLTRYIQNGYPLSQSLLHLLGFTERTFPRATPEALAFIVATQSRLGGVFRGMNRALQSRRGSPCLDVLQSLANTRMTLHEVETHPDINALRSEHFKSVDSLFR